MTISRFSQADAQRLISNVIDERINLLTKSGAGIDYTWGTVAAVSSSYECSVYLFGETVPSPGFKFESGIKPNVLDPVRVAIDRRGNRWIDAVQMPSTGYPKIEIDVRNGEIRTGDGTVPPTARVTTSGITLPSISHASLTGVTSDQHHAQVHAIGGTDHTGSITDTQHGVRTLANAHAHSALSGIGANDHHAQLHASSHLSGASDEIPYVFTSYTPTLTNAGTATFSNLLGRYVKFGKLVYVEMAINCSAAGSGGGTLAISTPSTIDMSSSGQRPTLLMHYSGLLNLTSNSGGGFATRNVGDGDGAALTFLRAYDYTAIARSNLAAGGLIYISGWYKEA